MLTVPNLANRRTAFNVNFACLTGTQAYSYVSALARRQLRCAARRPDKLTALARLQLNIVYERAYRNAFQRQ